MSEVRIRDSGSVPKCHRSETRLARRELLRQDLQQHVSQLGCPSKLVSIRNNRNWNRNLFRHYPKQNICFGFFSSIPKQRVSMFRLNRNKQKTNRNSLKGSIFCNFLKKIYGFSVFSVFFSVFSIFSVFFSVFSVCFETVCFGVSVVLLLYRNRELRLIRKKQKTHPNSLKESIFGYFSENLGLFRFVTVSLLHSSFLSKEAASATTR